MLDRITKHGYTDVFDSAVVTVLCSFYRGNLVDLFKRSWLYRCCTLSLNVSSRFSRAEGSMHFTTCHRILRYFTRHIHTNRSPNFTKYQQDALHKQRARSITLYVSGIGVLVVGLSYAAVPLYRVFCQAFSYGGTVTSNSGQNTSIKIIPGETALAFYTAKNPTDKAITGVSTYNVLPYEAGQYFNKIQCFCFEEQQLNPHEEVDMPVFFYIDPEFADDPKMEHVNEIILSYTFFEAKAGLKLPIPSYVKKHIT
ncbi:hypothetical protein KM043_007723 [Ampulex compressa]|nr:hypothetical protein KM043_007723 [Ampulex compressa]